MSMLSLTANATRKRTVVRGRWAADRPFFFLSMPATTDVETTRRHDDAVPSRVHQATSPVTQLEPRERNPGSPSTKEKKRLEQK